MYTGDLAMMMTEYWGECFPMGGIGGAPYVGKTGFGAFSAHVPDDGNIIIMFGPHIAISESGELGQYLREGQTKHSSACGAVLGAYAQCKHATAGTVTGKLDDLDMQMDWLRHQISQCLGRVDSADDPLSELTYAVFEMIQVKLTKIVNTKFGSGRLVLMGGIQINMPAPYVDHFMPLQFDVLSSQEQTMNLLQYLVWDGANLSDLEVPTRPAVLDSHSLCNGHGMNGQTTEPPANWKQLLEQQQQEIAALQAELEVAKTSASQQEAELKVAKAAAKAAACVYYI